MRFIKFFDQLSINDTAVVGGKNSSLAQMYVNLKSEGIEVPFGFATTSDAYRLFIKQNDLEKQIKDILEDIDISDIKNLENKGKIVRELILKGTMPQVVQDEISKAYKKLSDHYNRENIDVAVRSSATAEDLPDASFAGQQETYLNIDNEEELQTAVKRCFASLFTNRAISYRQSRGYDHMKVALSTGVQKMVRSDKASSGIMFTIDTESGSEDLIMINSIYGIGENIVSGNVTPDEFVVFKPMLKENRSAILKRKLGNKNLKMIYDKDEKTKNIKTSQEQMKSYSLSDDEIIELANKGLTIEKHYIQIAGKYRAMDIEWAKDGIDGKIYIVQARPETVQSQRSDTNKTTLYKYKLTDSSKKEVILKGKAVGEKIGRGRVNIINDLNDAHKFKEGEILVANTTDPDWEPLMKKASAVITNKEGRTCHASIVAREIGVPAIVGTSNGTEVLQNDQKVTVSCANGEEGIVYEGTLDFIIEKINLDNLKQTKTKLFVNVGDPQKAFSFASLPNMGVGLARMEFIINNYIKAHPMALVNLSKGESVDDIEQIKEIIQGYDDPKKFFIDKLSEGISTIAAAFYPKPVIVRTSDFKSNEYKNMPGGSSIEKDEENPMIGFRGASRYYSKEYKEAFVWECEALKRVRDDKGLVNVKVMLPFVRTPVEGKKVVEIMNNAGLVQKKNNLEIYAMCEIPSNVIFADEFLKIFDGYSIGSNDLTQLMLGVDRDSEQISHIFDERNEAVTRVIKMAIDACKKEGKYIGICGQAPSDYPEITKFLVQNKIDSISLNPDSVVKMWQVVEELETNIYSK
ncbi:MAG: phosphoenolpyruvate synthase [Campylobacterota bacterium]|nr:phosphoenolpyruvate synthase [Campylobacterota bacterium]